MTNNFDVQSIAIDAPFDKVFSYIADPKNLPKWTKADEKSALMVTPNGQLQVGLKTEASREQGTIDWHMTMPDDTVASAFSRVTSNGKGSVYTFVLMAPPVPIEQVEGTLQQQKELLRQELGNLQRILGGGK